MKQPILSKEERVFREPSIFAVDAKAITLENVLVNLFMLMRNNGSRIKIKLSKQAAYHTIDSILNRFFTKLEQKTEVLGFDDNRAAAESWLRSNLINMVNRGKANENVSSLRPLHLESYRIRNAKHNKDYNTADQVYIMLNQCPEVRDALKRYMMVGWDPNTNKLIPNETLDVDTAGLLHLIKEIDIDTKQGATLNGLKPLLKKQAALFCDDIMRLLSYEHNIPRSVFIDYLRILTGFHLALYFHQLIYQLPLMVKSGSAEEICGWSMVVDMTDKLESPMSEIAVSDMEQLLEGMFSYIQASYTVKAVKRMPGNDNLTVDELIHQTVENPSGMDAYFNVRLSDILDNYRKDAKTDEEREEAEAHVMDLNEYLQYEDSPLQKYVQCLMKVGAKYQLKYGRDFMDKASMKNTESSLMIDGKSRKHQRRGAIGSKLLEVLVQLLVLNPKTGGGFTSNPLSIRELIREIRSRYGIIIDGTDEERFKDADVRTQLAFKANVDALKSKLRQIGFFTDLSDASSLQKIRPRYKFND